MITKVKEAKLVTAAQEGVRNALTRGGTPDEFRIGAAVLTDKGSIYSSGQYHSDTGSLTLHAEQAALAHAAAHGEYGIEAIAVSWNAAASGKSDDSIYPCHMCKQLMWESHLRSGKEMQIILADETSKILERLELTKIMSHTWPR